MSYRVLSRETVALEPPGPVVRPASSLARPSARGKFLFVGSEKFYVRGVTYGTFRPDESGSEFPAPTVRWLGARRVERYLERLCTLVRRADPGSLVTYVNYPTTEHLELPFVDFLGFNVYLESQEQFGAYLARLQNLAGDRPLLMTELGLDSLRNGEEAQASSIAWQVRSAFASGCAGAFVYAWTDEWYRGGADVDDWAFGLTRRDRSPKPA